MEIAHVKELSGTQHETYFIRWRSNKKYWIENDLETLPKCKRNALFRRIENFANGTLPLNIHKQFESYESFGEPIIYAVKYPGHRFYCVYDEIDGKNAVIFFHYLAKKSDEIPDTEKILLRNKRDCYFNSSRNEMKIIEAEEEDSNELA